MMSFTISVLQHTLFVLSNKGRWDWLGMYTHGDKRNVYQVLIGKC